MGSMRFRKSIKIAPGVRVNVGKKSVGVSAGVRGARYSVSSSGRRTQTVGIPGTGISHVSTKGSSGGQQKAAAPAAPPTPAQVQAVIPKPGLFANALEKQYRAALVAYISGDRAAALTAFEGVAAADASIVSAHLFAAISTDGDAEPARVIWHLEAVVSSNAAFPDKYMTKFLPPGKLALAMSVKITDLIEAQAPVDQTGASLALAEAYQEGGRLDEAIGLIQQLNDANPSDPVIRLSLADLLLSDNDFDGVVEVTAPARNEDDLTDALVHMRAAALFAQGHQTAAFEAFKDALAKTANRDPALLAAIRYDRASAYEAVGQKAKAKADFERLYAADPNYSDIRERLAALSVA
jgi:tetratricopeptide (TPR) repeat protein